LADGPPAPVETPAIESPPPAPPIVSRPAPPSGSQFVEASVPGSPPLYSIGNPTDEEQLFLEFINQGRANPTAEANRMRNTTDSDVLAAYAYHGVDLNLMVTQISGYVPSPPLSFNAQLITAARRHSADQLARGSQGHVGSDGSDPGSRMTAAGYLWTSYGENVYAACKSIWHGHAGFEVDWGPGPGGMQTPAGHRNNNHAALFREVGIGVTNGFNGTVGPITATQDFGTRNGITPFVTGVAFYDFNGNNFYDLGEGLGGVTVNVNGSAYYAVTANSGGYSVPVPGNGSYLVTFSAPGLATVQQTVSVANNANVKVDFKPAYSPPRITGPGTPQIGQANAYTFTPVGAAAAYQWRQSKRVAVTAVEGAEGGLASFTRITTTNYSVLTNTVKASGSFSFHLAHTTPSDQYLTWNKTFLPLPGSALVLSSRLGWATTNQKARIQVTADNGQSWQDLWTALGNGAGGQTAFARVTNSLSAYVNQEVQIRFLYDHLSGTYFNQSASGVGWYLDDIGFVNTDELIDNVVRDIPTGTGFIFTPAESTNYLLRVRARVGERFMAWGPGAFTTGAGTASSGLAVRILSAPVLSQGRARFNVSVAGGPLASIYVETAANPAGPWTRDTSATLAPIVSGSLYRANCSTGPSGRFYRVVAR
jgi:hypothetical protein